ncbi:hypothetical protein BH18ACT11_BH18ACT11_29650 [soil metagenome]
MGEAKTAPSTNGTRPGGRLISSRSSRLGTLEARARRYVGHFMQDSGGQVDCCDYQNYRPFSAALQLSRAQVFSAFRRVTSSAEGVVAGYLLLSS